MSNFFEIFDENQFSRGASGQALSGERRFIVSGANSAADATNIVSAQLRTSTNWFGMSLPTFDVAEDLRHGTYIVRATYRNTAASGRANGVTTEQAPRYSFDTTGRTEHITHSFNTEGIYTRPGEASEAIDFGRAIEVEDGNIKGLDIIKPMMQKQITIFRKPNLFTTKYEDTLYNLTGCVNSLPFLGRPAGEVLFTGARGDRTGDDSECYWQIVFNFILSPNISEQTIDGIIIPRKRGWDYMWQRCIKAIINGIRQKKANAIYVEQVYKYKDLNKLGVK